MKTISASAIINSNLALSGTEGNKVYEAAMHALKAEPSVAIDVSGLDVAITAFFRASFGKLASTLGSSFSTRIIPKGIDKNADFQDKYDDVLIDATDSTRAISRQESLDTYFAQVC
jgi:hypothetical protein